MIANKMLKYIENSSAIRAMFEDGKKLAEKYGAENVYDFSLGNPNLAPPVAVKDSIIDVLNTEEPTFIHGYMDNAGYPDVRDAVAASINKKFETDFSYKNILMTVGAAGGLNVIFKTLLDPGDEVVTFAPYFGEYNSYTANYDAKLVAISPDTSTFQPKLDEFKAKLTARTKIVLVNSPNNPTGVVYSEATIKQLTAIMIEKQAEFGTDIYLIADEPYRELAYDGVHVPYLPKYYANTIVGYSWSKSLSLPGERIGYLVIPSEIADYENIFSGATTANRIMGYVNSPSLQQRAVARCLDAQSDIGFYDKNRKDLYEGLLAAGYECIKPEGAFYLFVKSPLADDKAFCEIAKNDFQLLIVPGSAFGCPGYVRMAYCVANETIIGAHPKFKALIDSLKK